MEFKDIMAIAGRPGLYSFIAQGRNSVIVENIESGKRISAFGAERISSFEEISVFTRDGDLPLAELFDILYTKLEGKETISPKSKPGELKKFLKQYVPEYDEDRVYPSDIKKLFSWYNLLVKQDLLKGLLEEYHKKKTEESAETDEEKQGKAKDKDGGNEKVNPAPEKGSEQK